MQGSGRIGGDKLNNHPWPLPQGSGRIGPRLQYIVNNAMKMSVINGEINKAGPATSEAPITPSGCSGHNVLAMAR